MKVKYMETAEQAKDEIVLVGLGRDRTRYLWLDLLFLVGFTALLWFPIGSPAVASGSSLVVAGWIFIAFCLHMATFRITIGKMASVRSLMRCLASRLPDEEDLTLMEMAVDLINGTEDNQPVSARLPGGEHVKLSLVQYEGGSLAVRIRKVGF